ncbi:RNA 2',3'-cyclic phosphodiesterase [Fictibacillus phosphorivorans]|uniref:RNA 2',3'-cyclic phosphodiesterase n=1 Tax=Fictibacillus phosphorivorans TaxID=1221500 RepID=UPI00203BE187|nr:RNA 2',3'-cyclic phosphodiesterase [Fictibacillus phosphorivorans]MCM3717996.1 RNA 2',3'-cyclic phosphodiesterase [Fictibacillus phosphorivorans]MCM3775445.1 RNA 2',3'-cyclic phosphodiesterase [Fictibacillus phosphorivorans]
MERHFFIALKLPADLKKALHHMCQEIKEDNSFKTWVHPEDYHITLTFLGKASQDQLKQLPSLLEEVVQNEKTFELYMNHFGFFGNKERPRIFWAGVEEQVKLYNLQNQIALACEKAGFSLEKRSYSPHITLARKLLDSSTYPVDSEKWWNDYGRDSHFLAEQVVLYETHFEKQPKYHIVQSFSLQR